jgi:hypothetical protein
VNCNEVTADIEQVATACRRLRENWEQDGDFAYMIPIAGQMGKVNTSDDDIQTLIRFVEYALQSGG